jgi:hypothetical protein
MDQMMINISRELTGEQSAAERGDDVDLDEIHEAEALLGHLGLQSISMREPRTGKHKRWSSGNV